MMHMLKKKKQFRLERSYAAPIDVVWRAWTDAEQLQQWWGPDKTFVPECRVDPTVGGEIHVVMEAGEGMGKYAGTRWPMSGTFTAVDQPHRLAWDARSWTEGEEDTATILHVNEVSFAEADGKTTVILEVTITDIGSKAKMAAIGMKMGYKATLGKLDEHLSTMV